MSGVAISLVLGSAILHATWNARAHTGEDRVITLAVAYATGVLLLSPWLLADRPTEVLGLMVLSGFAHGGYLWFLSQAYARGGLVTTYPLARGTAPLIVAALGVWLLGQTPSLLTVLGAVVVAVGLVIIGGVAWGKGERASIATAMATGAFIASYTLLDARAAQDTSALGYFAGVAVVAVIVVLTLARATVARVRASLRSGVVVGVLLTSAYGLVLLAYTRADAANVATLRGTSILFGLALVPRTVTPRLVAGAAAIVAGAVLVAT